MSLAGVDSEDLYRLEGGGGEEAIGGKWRKRSSSSGILNCVGFKGRMARGREKQVREGTSHKDEWTSEQLWV